MAAAPFERFALSAIKFTQKIIEIRIATVKPMKLCGHSLNQAEIS